MCKFQNFHVAAQPQNWRTLVLYTFSKKGPFWPLPTSTRSPVTVSYKSLQIRNTRLDVPDTPLRAWLNFGFNIWFTMFCRKFYFDVIYVFSAKSAFFKFQSSQTHGLFQVWISHTKGILRLETFPNLFFF